MKKLLVIAAILMLATSVYAFNDIVPPAQCNGQPITCVQGEGTCTAQYCPTVELYSGAGKFMGVESNCPNQCKWVKTCSCGTYTWEEVTNFQGSVRW